MSDLIFAGLAALAMFASRIAIGAALASRATTRDARFAAMWRSMQAANRLHAAFWTAREQMRREAEQQARAGEE